MELAREFNLAATSISNWVRAADKRAAAAKRSKDNLGESGQETDKAKVRRLERKLARKEELEIWESAGLLRTSDGPVVIYSYIQAEKAADPGLKINVICKVLGVSRSGYYDWLKRIESPPTKQVLEQLQLIDRIRVLHRKHRYYGSPRIHRDLLTENVQVGRHKVAHLMRINGICARRGKTKARPGAAPPARRPEVEDAVKRDFHADVADALWFTDIDQIRTLQGWLFAAVILDAYNREVISYAVDGHQTPKTAMRALTEAPTIRHRRRAASSTPIAAPSSPPVTGSTWPRSTTWRSRSANGRAPTTMPR